MCPIGLLGDKFTAFYVPSCCPRLRWEVKARHFLLEAMIGLLWAQPFLYGDICTVASAFFTWSYKSAPAVALGQFLLVVLNVLSIPITFSCAVSIACTHCCTVSLYVSVCNFSGFTSVEISRFLWCYGVSTDKYSQAMEDAKLRKVGNCLPADMT
jgi:hypothetical protein